MTGECVVTLDHTDLVRAVQEAMAAQLRRDGKLRSGMELGLTFYATTTDDLHVVGRVRQGGRVLHELTGRKSHLSAVAAQLALNRLKPGERQNLLPTAAVHWRVVRLTDADESLDRFMADVHFLHRTA